MSIFEIIMLSCFGLSWPIAAYKSYKTGRAAGKSLLFMAAIWIGYVAGILHKLIYSRDLVIYLYVFNLLMVSLDIALTRRNIRRERSEQDALSGKKA
ncbi:MAG: hypothetical protein PHQ83_06880 [Eubacteriales bacterium]|nr:hypothetical protein [Eubacteriales bacterium]